MLAETKYGAVRNIPWGQYTTRSATTIEVTRQPDPRMAQAIRAALGDARTVLNVGAGTGSDEPTELQAVAVEPSRAMIQQRPAGAAPVVQAVAEHLPWADAAFDATLAIPTIHHWHDRAAGLAELQRVAQHRVVLLNRGPTRREPSG